MQQEELERVFVEYYPQIVRVVRRRLGTTHVDAEDVVSTIFLDLCKSVLSGGFKNNCALPTFLFVITNRRIADKLRESYKQRRVVDIDLSRFPDKDDTAPRSDLSSLYRMAGRVFFKSLSIHSMRDQKVILDYYELGYSRDDLAIKYDLSVQRVSTILTRFLKILEREGENNVANYVEGTGGRDNPKGNGNGGSG